MRPRRAIMVVWHIVSCALLQGVSAAVVQSPRDAARLAATCDGADVSSVHLLQTGVASIGSAASAVGAVASPQTSHKAERLSLHQIGQVSSTAASGVSANGRSWSRGAGNAIYIILPVVGFILAVVAIIATVMFENSMPQTLKGETWQRPDLRLPLRLSGSRAAEGLLPVQVQGAPASCGQQAQEGKAPKEPATVSGYRRPAPKVAAPDDPGVPQLRPPPEQGEQQQGQQEQQQQEQQQQQHEQRRREAEEQRRPPLTDAALEPASELEIVVPALEEGQIIGLGLSEEGLVVTRLADPSAAEYGFQVGDRILKVNKLPVLHQADFVAQFKVARKRNMSVGEPLVFTVARGEPAADAHDWMLWSGTWEYEDESQPSGCHRYSIRPDGDSLVFEQQLPDGEAVRGVLRPGPRDGALEADLFRAGGEPYGVVRFRLGEALVSNLRVEGAAAFGEDVLASRAFPKETAAKKKKMKEKKGFWVC